VKIAQITGGAAYLPQGRLDNAELVKAFPKWTEDKLRRKLGIATRCIASTEETATDLAEAAARRLFDEGIARPEEIDFLVLCTQSPDYHLPTSACLLQERLGLRNECGAFDINLGCSGYIYGLGVCKGLIESGLARKVLFITAETYCKYINELDSVTRPLFSDGAAATLLEECESPSNDPLEGAPAMGHFEFGTAGAGADMLVVKAGGARLPSNKATRTVRTDARGNRRSQEQLYMNGPGVFRFSIDVVPPLIKRFEDLVAEREAQIDAYLLHQANKFVLDRLRDLAKIDPDKYFNDIEMRGNTVSSTIPIAIIDAVKAGLVKPGSLALLVGFGVGLSWGACLVRFPENFRVAFLD
jgi:3-oxoacyl-[acyl-carrier-protein] synthase-3